MATPKDSPESATNPSDLSFRVNSMRNEITELKENSKTAPTRITDLESRVLDLECKNKIQEAEKVLRVQISEERKWYIGIIIALVIALVAILSHFL